MDRETSADTVVLIHGLWMTPLSWEHWVTHYEQRGLRVITPGYPGVLPGEAGVRAIRDDPSPLAGLGVREIFDHLSEVVGALDAKPIIIGHSFGGVFVQLLLDAGHGTAGVSVDGAAVKGLKALPLSEIKATFPVLRNPANRRRAVPITEKEFHYAFTNNLSVGESRKVFDRYAIPVSGRMLFQASLANFTPNAVTTYDFANGDRAPLLFIAGGDDHMLPPPVQRENYEKNAKHSEAVTAFRLFDGRSHYTCGEPGWEAVADFALDWALAPVPGELGKG
ncbi:alpha/beta hydrolase [Streptomyces formicae]|uniref:Putative Arylesterase-related n=1 Tax=Streptomyces formicae TaxID=1616117 RepID=A0A291QNB7_9ACTN|nr:alpha/beta hydrolase [Streptomyces formicae]ATL33026.1 putative Arylesterase-related [Streptomyces formicae]